VIVSDYTALIPGQNQNKPKFIGWLAANLQPIVDAQQAANELYKAFILDTAVGVQLDILGQQLGQSRTVNFIPEGGVSSTLNDDLYRLILKAAILKNTWKGTRQEIYDFWIRVFPQYPIIIVDNQDMSMSYSIFGLPLDPSALMPFTYDSPTLGYDAGYWVNQSGGLLRELILHHYLTPKPAGVSVSYSFPTQVIFAYDQNSTYLKGYNAGNWIST
jgi:hypothetical protein